MEKIAFIKIRNKSRGKSIEAKIISTSDNEIRVSVEHPRGKPSKQLDVWI